MSLARLRGESSISFSTHDPALRAAKIAELIDDWFYRTATDFRWDMHAPVSDGRTLWVAENLGDAVAAVDEAAARRPAPLGGSGARQQLALALRMLERAEAMMAWMVGSRNGSDTASHRS